MDRKSSERIFLIALGFLILTTPLIFRGPFSTNILWISGCVGVGLNIMLYGWLRGRSRIIKPRRDEYEHRRGSPRTNSEIIGIMGVIVFFTSLGIGIVSTYVISTPLLFGLFLLLFAVGVSMAFASNIMVREERRKEKQEQMYPH